MTPYSKRSIPWTYGLLTITAVFWGSAFTGSKLVVASVSPAVGAFIRFGLGAMFMMIILFSRNRQRMTIPRQYWLQIIFLGLMGVALYNWFFFMGLDFSKATDGSMIIPVLSPVVTFLLALVFLKERVTLWQGFGLLLALTGSLVFFSAILSEGGLDHRRLIGDLTFLASAFCWSVYTMVGNRLLQQLDSFPVTAYAMLSGALILGAIAAPDLIRVSWSDLGVDFWLIQIYLALFPTVLANWFYSQGVQTLGPSKAAVFMYFVPVSGLILSGAILGERLTLVQMVGSVFMLAGVWLVNRCQKTSAKGMTEEKAV